MKKNNAVGQIIGREIEVNNNNQIIIGIDPGLNFLGIGIIEVDPEIQVIIEINSKNNIKAQSLIPLINKYTHMFLKINQKKEISEKLYYIYKTIDKLIEQYKANLIIVEDSFVGLNKNSAIKIGVTRGSILTAIGKNQSKVKLIAPKQIKMELTGKGTSTKEEIEEFLEKNLENWEKPKKLDSTDALAAAICGIKYILDLESFKKA